MPLGNPFYTGHPGSMGAWPALGTDCWEPSVERPERDEMYVKKEGGLRIE